MPVQKRSQNNVSGGERFGLTTLGESKSDRTGPLSSNLLSAADWENGLAVEYPTGCLVS